MRKAGNMMIWIPLIFILIGLIFIYVGYQADPEAKTDDGHSLRFFWYVMGAWFIGLTLALYAGILYFTGRSTYKRQKLRETGRPGIATVLTSEATGGELNNMPQVEMELQVEVDGMATYGVLHREYVNPVNLAAVRKGACLPVLIDTKKPERLMIDWSRM